VAPRSDDPTLVIRVINFELVQPVCPRYINDTDRQTDGWTTYDRNTAIALRASHGKKTVDIRRGSFDRRCTSSYCRVSSQSNNNFFVACASYTRNSASKHLTVVELNIRIIKEYIIKFCWKLSRHITMIILTQNVTQLNSCGQI